MDQNTSEVFAISFNVSFIKFRLYHLLPVQGNPQEYRTMLSKKSIHVGHDIEFCEHFYSYRVVLEYVKKIQHIPEMSGFRETMCRNQSQMQRTSKRKIFSCSVRNKYQNEKKVSAVHFSCFPDAVCQSFL